MQGLPTGHSPPRHTVCFQPSSRVNRAREPGIKLLRLARGSGRHPLRLLTIQLHPRGLVVAAETHPPGLCVCLSTSFRPLLGVLPIRCPGFLCLCRGRCPGPRVQDWGARAGRGRTATPGGRCGHRGSHHSRQGSGRASLQTHGPAGKAEAELQAGGLSGVWHSSASTLSPSPRPSGVSSPTLTSILPFSPKATYPREERLFA